MDEIELVKSADVLEYNKKLITKEKQPKIQTEKATRYYIMELAKLQGCEGEVQKIFDRTDRLLRNCSNSVERKHIAIMSIAELHKLLNMQKELVIDGMEIIPQKD